MRFLSIKLYEKYLSGTNVTLKDIKNLSQTLCRLELDFSGMEYIQALVTGKLA
jgi:hypothetical protein